MYTEKAKKGFSRRHLTAEALINSRREREECEGQWEATIRNNAVARSKRSPAQQIAVLDKRLGVAQGAVKERGRLLAQTQKHKKRKKSNGNGK